MKKTKLTTTFARLRDAGACSDGYRKLAKPLTSTNTEAALRAALEPFAALLDPGEDWGAITIVDVGVRIEDVRRARDLLYAPPTT